MLCCSHPFSPSQKYEKASYNHLIDSGKSPERLTMHKMSECFLSQYISRSMDNDDRGYNNIISSEDR